MWRTPNGSSWERLPDAPFAGRAYHAMLSHGACIFVMGGQTVALLGDPFFNDVWRSCDGGETWDSLGHAPWQPRAGLAFATHNGRMVVAGGCFGSSIGAGRKFLNDVWATRDGASWELLTANASWSARSGPRLVDFNGRLLLLAGEVGFTADTQLGDIWESGDGATWTLLTATPAFSARSGHGVVNAGGSLLLIAGWHDAKCLHDQWLSEDGVVWRMVSNATWACTADACGRFDFGRWRRAAGCSSRWAGRTPTPPLASCGRKRGLSRSWEGGGRCGAAPSLCIEGGTSPFGRHAAVALRAQREECSSSAADEQCWPGRSVTDGAFDIKPYACLLERELGECVLDSGGVALAGGLCCGVWCVCVRGSGSTSSCTRTCEDIAVCSYPPPHLAPTTLCVCGEIYLASHLTLHPGLVLLSMSKRVREP